jgi:hypothetical protein
LLFEIIIYILHHLNLVELFKVIANKLACKEEDNKKYESIAIDIFIVFKYMYIYLIWLNDWSHNLIIYSVYYLIFMNVFTYFNHHVWDLKINDKKPMSLERERRRFISLAGSYNNIEISAMGEGLASSQLIVTFVFIIVILSNSVPKKEE